ncbi:hypothetical protein Tco_1409294 [Tanacetum coccineum]
MDVKTTFLNGHLKEEVYVNQPDGFSKRLYMDSSKLQGHGSINSQTSCKAWELILMLSRLVLPRAATKTPSADYTKQLKESPQGVVNSAILSGSMQLSRYTVNAHLVRIQFLVVNKLVKCSRRDRSEDALQFLSLERRIQLVDMFTKALPEDMFKYLVRRLGMRCLTPEELEVLANESA